MQHEICPKCGTVDIWPDTGVCRKGACGYDPRAEEIARAKARAELDRFAAAAAHLPGPKD